VNIGLFGGTFDPPHTGHLIVAQDAALALGLDRILFVPAARPPHKAGHALTAAKLRVAMLELAVGDDPRFAIEGVELLRSGPSYTVDTLRALHQARPGTAWTLLVGADQYADFGTWREPGEILRLARLGVLSRGGSASSGGGSAAAGDGERVVHVAVTRIDISSTDVRRRVAAGLSIRYLVPAPVASYIDSHRLYAETASG
jgi:nicotinate-nucleotide adenylyltransferase